MLIPIESPGLTSEDAINQTTVLIFRSMNHLKKPFRIGDKEKWLHENRTR